MKAVLQGWNFMRVIRLLLGIIILIQGIIIKDIPSAILGIVFGGMAAANIGCCSTNACTISPVTPKNKTQIKHEEKNIIK